MDNIQKPFYLVHINEDDDFSGVNFISLVDEPAMQVNWISLSKEIEEIHFSADVDKKLLYGVIIMADKYIYRKNIDGYLKFTKDNIISMVRKWSKSDLNKNINFQHTDKIINAFVRESWIVEEGQDKINNYIKDVVPGSWVGVVEVEDEDFWKDYVKTGVVNGFSIEMLPSMLVKEEIKLSVDRKKDKLYELLFKDKSSIDDVYEKVRKLLLD